MKIEILKDKTLTVFGKSYLAGDVIDGAVFDDDEKDMGWYVDNGYAKWVEKPKKSKKVEDK